jgi:hypothetical protein
MGYPSLRHSSSEAPHPDSNNRRFLARRRATLISGQEQLRNDENRPAPKAKVLFQLQRDSTSPVLAAKIFRFAFHSNQTYNLRRPVAARGAFRDRHERWLRDAVDAAMSKDERQRQRTAKSRGTSAADLKFLQSL